MPEYTTRLVSNVKSIDGKPWEVTLGPMSFIFGPVRANKTAIPDALSLALTGAIDLPRKPGVEDAKQIIGLAPAAADGEQTRHLFAHAYIGDRLIGRYDLRQTDSGSVSEPEHWVDTTIVDKALVLPLRTTKSIVDGGVAAARTATMKLAAKLQSGGDADPVVAARKLINYHRHAAFDEVITNIGGMESTSDVLSAVAKQAKSLSLKVDVKGPTTEIVRLEGNVSRAAGAMGQHTDADAAVEAIDTRIAELETELQEEIQQAAAAEAARQIEAAAAAERARQQASIERAKQQAAALEAHNQQQAAIAKKQAEMALDQAARLKEEAEQRAQASQVAAARQRATVAGMLTNAEKALTDAYAEQAAAADAIEQWNAELHRRNSIAKKLRADVVHTIPPIFLAAVTMVVRVSRGLTVEDRAILSAMNALPGVCCTCGADDAGTADRLKTVADYFAGIEDQQAAGMGTIAQADAEAADAQTELDAWRADRDDITEDIKKLQARVEELQALIGVDA